jgi:carbamoyl-phosphate synthase large subunit
LPRDDSIRKILLLGSGAIKIGEAGEFDYSGSQALKALKEEGIETVLVNPNIATIQTDKKLSDKVYFLPVTPDYVEQVIHEERPDSILLGFGGQTALNCGVKLARSGVLERYNVSVLGTPIRGIELTEDRDLFKQTMEGVGINVPRSRAVYSQEEAREVASEIGYPVIIRVAYTLGGRGGGVAHNEYELDEIVQRGLASSIAHQVLVEEYVGTWKQIEYEVMRDRYDNSLVVCNMENVLAMRVHTGDNTVVAPSQTLNNVEYHTLRSIAIKAARACQVVGECNIQFALDVMSDSYFAIEINARLSRSSALASKATGYPIAYVATKLALGYSLSELKNKVTGVTTACFEPALDYVVLKMPRFDFRKFERVSNILGTQMKSVGEVMAIGRCFEEALQKAMRMVDQGYDGLPIVIDNYDFPSVETIEFLLSHPSDRIFADIALALEMGISPQRISNLTYIDEWFISKIANIVNLAQTLHSLRKKFGNGLNLDEHSELIFETKRLGFSDAQLSRILGIPEGELRTFRQRAGIAPNVMVIDTLAGEWPSQTNYLYTTYEGSKSDEGLRAEKKPESVIVLGGGTYRIGSSVEFDWCTMNMVWGLRKAGVRNVAVVNCNPETVSTDYDMSDRLYFEEITLERILDIYERENPIGIVCCVGGQTPNTLVPKLAQYGVRILGTSSVNVDRAEDRSKFSSLLDELRIPQPEWSTANSIEEASGFASSVGYPIIVRPSYVLSGAAMKVVWTGEHLEKYLKEATRVSPDYPVVVSKFVRDAKEVEIDAVSDGKDILVGAIIEHLERAGVHSGDATMRIPAEGIPLRTREVIIDYTQKIARALQVIGPFNIQFIVKGEEVMVIECNLRASRSMPFVSKMMGINLMEIAAKTILGAKLDSTGGVTSRPVLNHGVKVPQFSFMQLEAADPLLGVEMQSTGEVACFGSDFFDAFYKALTAAGLQMPKEGANIFVSVGGTELKHRLLQSVRRLYDMGYNIYATEHTAEFLRRRGVTDVHVLYKISEPERNPNIGRFIAERKIDLVLNIPQTIALEKYADMLEDEYLIRRKAVELGIPVLTNLEVIETFVKGLAWVRAGKLTIAPLA